MTTILDGKKLSKQILDDLTIELAKLDKKPSLTVIQVGENPASEIYVNIKKKTAERIGIVSNIIKYPETISEKELLIKIEELNNDEAVNAVLVQLPLPKHINSKNIIQAISPKKDVDGFHPENVGKLAIGVEPYAYPCTPKGVLRLLEEYKIELEGKHVVILGRSNIVGRPLAQMALNKNATVTICHSYTKNLSDITKTADILISAVGVKNIIKNGMVKKNSVIVDVGICKDVDCKICGDVDFEKVFEDVSFISPVPGGVGPMTIASLMENTFELYRLTK
jgi:methylenetetrahydrofolate dehydrogenase (NADP+)/methenyltetrahydrofolate cyclohydrolase